LLVNDDFNILFGFLEGDRPEVAGRSAPAVPAVLRERIAKFASGAVTEEERAEMKKLLQDQPDLIPILVMETRALRESQG
jgi:predicted Zn-dependent peptidase